MRLIADWRVCFVMEGLFFFFFLFIHYPRVVMEGRPTVQRPTMYCLFYITLVCLRHMRVRRTKKGDVLLRTSDWLAYIG